MRELLHQIERAVRERGWLARQASMEAVGSPELITNMRRGRVPSVERIQALCDVLGLEFYVGPPREDLLLDEARLAFAVETAERGLAASDEELSYAEKARFLIAVYQLIGGTQAPANAARVREIIDVIRRTRTSRSRALGVSRER